MLFVASLPCALPAIIEYDGMVLEADHLEGALSASLRKHVGL